MSLNYVSVPTASGEVATVTAPCGSDGAAMYDIWSTVSKFPWPKAANIVDPTCWRMTGHPVTIGPSSNSLDEAIQIVNFDFNTSGRQPAVPNSVSLPGPVWA